MKGNDKVKISSIQIYAIRLPLHVPFVVSYDTYHHMPSIIVKMVTNEGIIGYGEAVADGNVTGETWEGVFHNLKSTLAPVLLNENPMNLEKIHDIMNNTIYGAPATKAAIDIACFDILGKVVNQPIYQLIGGRFHDEFPITHVISIGEPKAMAQEADEMLNKGYNSFKVKVGKNVKEDIERIKAIRREIGEHIPIRIDVNQGWKDSSTTIQVLKELQQLNIDWLEQPILADDIDGIVEIKEKSTIPIMIDEGLKGIKEMREIINKRAADKVNIKLMKCGGIYPAVKLAHQAEIANIECQVGSMVESSIGSAAGFHVAFSNKNITSVELTGPLKFSKDIGNLHYDVPLIRLNDQPGLGIQIDENILHELTAFQEIVK